MTANLLAPTPEFDLPAGRLEARRRHLVGELAAGRPGRRLGLALAPVAVAAAAIAVLLVAPWQTRGPAVVDRALAAVGAGPVIHAVVEFSGPEDVVVDLASGAERERVHRAEYWFDEDRGKLRASFSTDGSTVIESVETGRAPELDAALGGFATQYRDALEHGRARVVGDATVKGRPAKRIEFAPRSGGAVEEVTVDAQSYKPLTFQTTYSGVRLSPDWHVLTIESTPRDPADFVVPKPAEPRPGVGEVSAGRIVSLDVAERALGERPLWLGLSFGGHSLGSVELSQARSWLTDGSVITGVVVRLLYGDIHVSLGRDAAGRYAVGAGPDEYPTPPEGSVAVSGNEADGWQGELQLGDYAVSLSAPTKAGVIAAARALQ